MNDHQHDHDSSCGCEHEHHHHDNAPCSCGHDHHHHDHHGHACTCGCEHDPKPISADAHAVEVNGNELAILQTVLGASCLPVARLIGTKQGESAVVIDCLSPVYLYETSDTMDEVKAVGAVLKGLEDKGLLSLDYDMPINGFDYSLYTQSDLFAYFVHTIDEAKERGGFLCDTAQIELGSMAVTDLGEQVCRR